MDIQVLNINYTPCLSTVVKVSLCDYFACTRKQRERPIPLIRSNFKVVNGTRQQTNALSAFVDGNFIYGINATTANILRARTAGLMRDDGAGGLPLNMDADGKALMNPTNQARRVPATSLRLAGNWVINQNPGLLTMGTLFLREHNRRAAAIATANPGWTDEQIFQEARKWVIAHQQALAFNEYILHLGITLADYQGYNASVNPNIDNFFTAVSYRYGHAVVTDTVLKLDENYQQHPVGSISLADSYYNPNVTLAGGIEPLIRGFVSKPQGEVEPRFVESMQQNMFGQSGVNGTDMLSINLQRARDHGIPDYNTCREFFGLPRLTNFSAITSNAELAATLQAIYNTTDNIDPYIGGLAEDKVPGSHFGPLFTASIKDQFQRIRDGDWWYYRNKANGLFTDAEISEIEMTGLRDIILRNTNISVLPDDIWTLRNTSYLTCAANGQQPTLVRGAGTSGGNTNDHAGPFTPPNLQDGTVSVEFFKGSSDAMLRVKVTAKGAGWVGFGVAQPGSQPPNNMPGADMVIGRSDESNNPINDYHAVGHVPPVLDASVPVASSDVKPLGFSQANGQLVMEFERPYAATNPEYDVAINKDGANTFIVSYGDVWPQPHGVNRRGAIQLTQLFGSNATITGTKAVSEVGLTQRRAHGTLMAINFVVILPLGALLARQLRTHWIKSTAIKASLFYVHIATQVTGVAVATAGFVIATSQFGINYKDVMLSHGKLGVALLVLVYSQVHQVTCFAVANMEYLKLVCDSSLVMREGCHHPPTV
eukprot:jgi/Chrzof1/13452/Cz07g33210.t1